MDRTHNPEFTCMEIYVAYKDYLWMMEFTEQMLERVAMAVNGTTELTIDGKPISFKAPFRRLTMTDAIREKTGYAFPMGLDPARTVYDRYASNYIPRNFVIDRKGKVVLATVGYDEHEFEELIRTIEKTLGN